MTEADLSFLSLRVTRVGVGGKRSFDPTDKRRLVEARLRPGASLSGLALKAGVNANQSHKWVRAREQPQSLPSSPLSLRGLKFFWPHSRCVLSPD
jgi:transposase